MIIDTHSHLSDKRYENVDEVIASFKDVGGGLIIDVGYDGESSVAAKRLAEKNDICFFAVGYHPSEAGKDIDEAFIKSSLSHEKCVALGEIGLDYHYEGYSRVKQRELFERQLYAAREAKLPVVVHSREASADMLDTLKSNSSCLGEGFLMHCYSESKEQARAYLDLGGYFAFGGAITFKNARKEEVVRYVPTDRLMAETDCPYMTPEPFRGKINQPSLVRLVYEKLAEARGCDREELENAIRDNVARLFPKTKTLLFG